MRPLVIVGCGGFGREVLVIAEALNADGTRWSFEGFVDDAPSVGAKQAVDDLGSQVLGDLSVLMATRQSVDVVIAVGSPSARAGIWTRLRQARVNFPVLIHPDATVGRPVDLAEGVVIAPGARLSTSVQVGRHVHVDQNVTVGHDAVLGQFARLNPSACVSGAVSLGEGVLVGANATILQGINVGIGAIIGASACVTRPVPAGITVRGVPAR